MSSLALKLSPVSPHLLNVGLPGVCYQYLFVRNFFLFLLCYRFCFKIQMQERGLGSGGSFLQHFFLCAERTTMISVYPNTPSLDDTSLSLLSVTSTLSCLCPYFSPREKRVNASQGQGSGCCLLSCPGCGLGLGYCCLPVAVWDRNEAQEAMRLAASIKLLRHK